MTQAHCSWCRATANLVPYRTPANAGGQLMMLCRTCAQWGDGNDWPDA